MATPLFDSVTTGKTYSSLLISASISLSDEACENVQEQAGRCYTGFTLSSEDGSCDGNALACGTSASSLAVRYSQRADDTPATWSGSGIEAAIDSFDSQMS